MRNPPSYNFFFRPLERVEWLAAVSFFSIFTYLLKKLKISEKDAFPKPSPLAFMKASLLFIIHKFESFPHSSFFFFYPFLHPRGEQTIAFFVSWHHPEDKLERQLFVISLVILRMTFNEGFLLKSHNSDFQFFSACAEVWRFVTLTPNVMSRAFIKQTLTWLGCLINGATGRDQGICHHVIVLYYFL